MVNEIQRNMINKLKTSKYYSIIVDSASDISHIDQLSFYLWYIMPIGTPVERFLITLENSVHKSEELYEAIDATIKKYNINFSNMRDQAYDNADNMRDM